jgi:hypothetical protein
VKEIFQIIEDLKRARVIEDYAVAGAAVRFFTSSLPLHSTSIFYSICRPILSQSRQGQNELHFAVAIFMQTPP